MAVTKINKNPPFDRLRDHPSTGSGTTLRQAQGPPFDRHEPVKIANVAKLQLRIGV